MGKRPIPRQNNKQQQNQATQVATTTQTTAFYQGAIPPPEMLKGFDDLVPGSAERLIALAEQESLHRRSLEMQTLQANIVSQNHQNALNRSN
jgi:uncharacterized membrane protein